MIDNFAIMIHPNPGQACPKTWGGGDSKGGDDLVFWGGVNGGLTVAEKGRGYIGRTIPEKRKKGYEEFVTLFNVGSNDSMQIVRELPRQLLNAFNGDAVELTVFPSAYFSNFRDAFVRMYPKARLQVASGNSGQPAPADPPTIVVSPKANAAPSKPRAPALSQIGQVIAATRAAGVKQSSASIDTSW